MATVAPNVTELSPRKIPKDISQRKNARLDSRRETKAPKKSGKKGKTESAKKRQDEHDESKEVDQSGREENTSGKDVAKITGLVEMMGYARTDIVAATKRLEENCEALTHSSLIDMCCIVQQAALEKRVAETCTVSGREKEEPVVNSPDVSEECADETEQPSCSDGMSEELDFKERLRNAIEKRKMELRSAIDAMTFQCRVCNCSRATILLLPCGHLASCDDCLMDVRRCPINRCNKVVRGTKEVYFV